MFVRRLLSPPVLIGAALIIVVAVAGGFITNPLPIDTSVWTGMIDSRTPWLNTLMEGASWFFDPTRAVALALVAAFLIWRLLKKIMHAIYVLASVAFSGASSYVIKRVDERPRPDEAFRLITEDSFSYPSGHATAVTALIVSVVAVLTLTAWGRRLRRVLWLAAVVVIVFICVTRLYLGVHWLTDVIGGVGVGAGSSMILAPFLLRR